MKTRWFVVVIASLLVLPFAARAVTDTWDGGGINNLLTLDDNWLDNTAPVSDLVNTDLIFAGMTRLTPALTASFSTRSITFNITAGAFVIEGQPFDVGTGGIVNNNTRTMTLNNRVRFSGITDATINAASGGLTFGDSVTGPSGTLTVTGANATSFLNFFSATTVNKTGSGTMTWAPDANATIDLTIGQGTVTMGADGSPDLFTSSSSIAVNVTTTFNINESLTLDGAQLTRTNGANVTVAAGKTLTLQNGADAVITDNFINNTSSTIAVTGSGSTFSTTSFLALNGGSTLNITADGDVTSGGTITLGSAGNGTVTVDGNGSTLSGASFSIGANDGTGSVAFTNNSRGTFSSIGLVGSAVGGATGTLSVESGADVTGTSLIVAAATGANTGTVTVTGTGSTLSLNGATAPATIGAASASSGTLNVNSGGTFNSGGGPTVVNATGLVSINGGVFNVNGNLTINGGRLTRDAAGVFALDAGRTFTVQTGGDAVFTGAFTNNTASTIVVTGAGSTFSTTGNLGIEGGSTLNIALGGNVSTGTSRVDIGAFAGNGAVTVDGAGSSLSGGSLNLALNGNTGNLTFTNGSMGTFAGLGVSASNVAGTVGTLSIQSGATVTGASLFLSSFAAANTGTVTITGAGSALTLNGAATATIGAANSSNGTLNINSGGTFNSGTALTTVNATGTINLDSGTLNLRGPLDITGTLAITGTGTIQGSGSITKNAVSTLTFPNTNNYAGGTTLRGGTIVAGAATGALGSGNVIVESGALKLTIQTGVLSAIADTATLTLAGGGSPGVADNGFAELGAGVNDILVGLILGTDVQAPGTYGSTFSSAAFKSDEFFSGPGILTVIPEPGAATMLLGSLSVLLGLERFRRRN